MFKKIYDYLYDHLEYIVFCILLIISISLLFSRSPSQIEILQNNITDTFSFLNYPKLLVNKFDNLIEENEYKDQIIKLKNKLDNWFVKYVNPEIDGTKEAVYGNGQINLAGIYSKGEKSFDNFEK